MSVRLEQYRLFNTVAECGSLSAAAAKLYMTQSAVSQAVKQLEQSVGASLFVRLPKGVMLTDEGRTLYRYSSEALKMIATGEQRLDSLKHLAQGELSIGASDTVSSHFLLKKLELFHAKYPNIKIRVVNRVTSEAAELVKSGELDIGFGNLPYEDEELDIRPCMTVHDVFVGGEAYRNVDKYYSREELAALPLILLEQKSNSRRYVDNWFLSSGIRLRAEIELGAHDLLLQFAQIGLGVSCVIREFSGQYLEQKKVFELPMKTPVPAREIGVFHHRNFPLSPAAKRFTELL